MTKNNNLPFCHLSNQYKDYKILDFHKLQKSTFIAIIPELPGQNKKRPNLTISGFKKAQNFKKGQIFKENLPKYIR